MSVNTPQRGPLTLEPLGEWPQVRIDFAGTPVVSGDYDSMIAKVIARGETREEAREKLEAALGALLPLGIRTNRAYLRAILNDPVFIAGEADTAWLGRRESAAPAPDGELAAIAATILARGTGTGWSSNGVRRTPVLLQERGATVRVDVGSDGDIVLAPRGHDRDGAARVADADDALDRARGTLRAARPGGPGRARSAGRSSLGVSRAGDARRGGR